MHKKASILRRDFGVNISESSVGRTMKKPRFPRPRSALRCKRKRRFYKYAKPFKFKKYDAMTMGENVQIDHMTVTKNELKALASTFMQTFTAKQIALMPLNFYEN